LVEAARNVAQERNKKPDEYVITLSRSLVEPFLTFANLRDLRKQAWEAWISRGEMPDRDNLSVATKTLKLRKRIAEIHGYPSFAAYQCVDRMAKTPERVMELLENVWDRAKKSANLELESMEIFVKESGIELEGGIEPYDWRFIAEKVRKAKYDFDGALLKPYLPLNKVVEALFDVSTNLFGLKYKKRTDIVTYHPDVDTYEVLETLPDGSERLVSLFLHDNFARPFKSSGAWMSEYRSQTRNLAPSSDPIEGIPIVSNNNNFAKGNQATLLSYDDAQTLFHEFGHAHHGMLSNAGYTRLSSTNVLTDFVELPSQLMENWFEQREIIKKFARHYQTGEPVPDELLDKLEASRSFQQGFQTIEYTACALLDMALHQVQDFSDSAFDLAAFEKTELQRLGMPRGIVMRHRPAHFQHLFSTSMYAAGYYVYLWAEVLDADAFGAFEEAGDIFDKTTAEKARRYIYGAGNTEAPDSLFRHFRGREPQIEFMLRKRGLLKEKND
jgi:peptidyl-dipeptidase Dcp